MAQRNRVLMAKDEGRFVTNIIERRNESQKWLKKNLWDELTTVWQGIKCRTSPIYKRDAAGQLTNEEDNTRTNVAQPDLNIIYRRNAARMTANPYRLKYEGGQDPLVADMLSAQAMQQYDRSNERWHDVRLVLTTEAFGFGYTKLFWDKLSRTMIFRRAIVKNGKVVFRDRASIMRAAGAMENEVNGAVSDLGPEMSDAELNQFMAKSGTEVMVPTDLKKYEGPIVKWVFPGNLFLEPDCLSVDLSDYVIEQYRESDLWLKKQVRTLTYDDPETGETIPAFDQDAVDDLLSLEPDIEIRPDELADLFKTSIGRQDEQQYRLPKNLRVRPKYDILEQHAQDENDGRIWITWVAEKYRDKPLGRMPYPWDLYGKYTYTECVPLPDLLSAYGDSTPRLLRHLYNMHNLTVAQNFDYISNLIKPFLLRRAGLEMAPEVVVRGLFRELAVNDLNGIKPLIEPPLPNGAFEREAQIMRMMSICEPSLTTTDTGTSINPQAGQTATTAVLATKANDALTQFKFDGRNAYLRELGMKKLWMNQQAMQETEEIQKKYWGKQLADQVEQFSSEDVSQYAVSDRNGKTVAIRLDPMEMQEDYQVEPEAGSYLAVDDELRMAAAQQLEGAAQAAPGILDPRKVLRFHLQTIRGIGNPDDYFLPPQPPQPPIKGSINVSVPLDKMPADVTNQVLQLVGIQPSQELEKRDQLHNMKTLGEGLGKMGDAVNAVDDATSAPAEAQGERAHQQGMERAEQANLHKLQQQTSQAGLDAANMKTPNVPGVGSVQ